MHAVYCYPLYIFHNLYSHSFVHNMVGLCIWVINKYASIWWANTIPRYTISTAIHFVYSLNLNVSKEDRFFSASHEINMEYFYHGACAMARRWTIDRYAVVQVGFKWYYIIEWYTSETRAFLPLAPPFIRQ